MFGSGTIAALLVGGLLAFAIPTAAAVVYKLKNREVWLPSVFAGAGTFLVFALILESIVNSAVLLMIDGRTVLYCVYGALAAGIFEETGRFVTYKLLMRHHYTTKNAVYMGIGHGGFEAAMLVGVSYITYFIQVLTVNSVGGIDKFMEMATENAPKLAENTRALLDQLMQFGFGSMGMALYERVIAMTFHVCMSVVVYKAVTQRGKLWLYPLAVVLHAALDTPAVMFQTGIIKDIIVVYVIMTVFVAAVVFGTVMLTKKLPDKVIQ